MNLDLAFYWKLLLRRLPVMMLFILACSGLGVIAAIKLPDTWASSAKLLVERPQIAQVETIETDAVEELDVIQQKLTTRANLIDIANRFDVFEDIRDMEPDEVVEQMQEATDTRRSAGRDQATLRMTPRPYSRQPRWVAPHPLRAGGRGRQGARSIRASA